METKSWFIDWNKYMPIDGLEIYVKTEHDIRKQSEIVVGIELQIAHMIYKMQIAIFISIMSGDTWTNVI